jgi:hypothetical protein
MSVDQNIVWLHITTMEEERARRERNKNKLLTDDKYQDREDERVLERADTSTT